MATKEKIELEFLLKTSSKVLNTMLTSPSGLAEWFADDVNVKDDIFTFIWDGSEEDARLLTYRPNVKAKWIWLEDEEEGVDAYFEFNFEVDPMTKVVILKVIDFAEPDEIEETKALWENQINELKRVIGA
jgi:uncharacterized protein YndB with AHSA1/START domain